MTNKRKSVLIIGGGMQGSLVAKDLIERGHKVTIADVVQRNEDIPFVEVDVSLDQFNPLFNNVDLVVCALPAELGERCVYHTINSGVNCVDLSFTECDLRKFDDLAVQHNCTVLADCGLAPGLPNLIIGHLINKYGCLNSVIYYVGGVAINPNRNDLGYVPSWSIPDLCSEYTRPARILVNGKVITLPPPIYHTTHDLELINTLVGKMEAFYSDGARSLLSLDKYVPTILEKTLRWIGHIEKIQKITGVSGDQYNLDALESAYSSLERGTDDVVVLRVQGENDNFREEFSLLCFGNDQHTAMTRTTGHSCAAFAELVLRGYNRRGVNYPEDMGMFYPNAFDAIFNQLRNYSIRCNNYIFDKNKNCYV